MSRSSHGTRLATSQRSLRYLTVAVGRDYRDVAPVSGAYCGSFAGRLSAARRMSVTRVEREIAASNPRDRPLARAPVSLREDRCQPSPSCPPNTGHSRSRLATWSADTADSADSQAPSRYRLASAERQSTNTPPRACF